MQALETYISSLQREAPVTVAETAHYGKLQNLLNIIGESLGVLCVLHSKNVGAGLPDAALYAANELPQNAAQGEQDFKNRILPKHGVIEAKGLKEDLKELTESEQVSRYLNTYGQVLVTNFYQFALVLKVDGTPTVRERFDLTQNSDTFIKASPRTLANAKGVEFQDFVARVMLHSAPLGNPKDVANILALYAKAAKIHLEGIGDLPALQKIRTDLETALGIPFEGDAGDRFFRSTLVQTLFYGVFSAWVLWHESKPPDKQKFDLWRDTRKLNVPVISELFHQLTDPGKLKPLGLEKLLDWTTETLNRVDRSTFFNAFESGSAVQYFYEPFLEAFDAELRKELGVWYTPSEIVEYMVARVDHVLQTELNTDGLADPNVYILDPCCGTGAYLVAVLKRIYDRVRANEGDLTAANAVRDAIQTRIFGFEILPAPFVVAHLQLGLLLALRGTPLEDDQRAQVFLTNALIGWASTSDTAKQLTLEALAKERDSAKAVKQGQKILVVIGNPPYNAFAGTSPEEEDGLVEIYKTGLRDIHGIKKFNLDELYIRFMRLAERCITELNAEKHGIVCYISNFSYLSDPSFLVMRQRFLNEFDKMWFDSLNGDSRETGKRIPKGLPNGGRPDPSVFSTDANREGIQTGTTIGLLVRKKQREAQKIVRYRDFWGASKRADLQASLAVTDFDQQYQITAPTPNNRYNFRPYEVSPLYETWPKLVELCAESPSNGLMEKRRGALIDIDRDVLETRMQKYYDRNVSWSDLQILNSGLTKNAAGFDAVKVRLKVQKAENFNPNNLLPYAIRPFDIQWCYYSSISPLWNRSRPDLRAQNWNGNDFLMSRVKSEKENEGVPFYYTKLISDDHCLSPDASCFPFRIRTEAKTAVESAQPTTDDMFADHPITTTVQIRANLSEKARTYLVGFDITDVDTNPESAALIWLHALAVGYSPAYLTDHKDGIQGDWPRVPLPAEKDALINSARLGRQIADLLDTEHPVRGVTAGDVSPKFNQIAILTVTEGIASYKVDVGWGHLQTDKVMPGRGRLTTHDDGSVDVYLNDTTYWKNIPEAVWNYTIGGYQVLKKWLSYRETKILGRDLKPEETREFMHSTRRIAALIALQPDLDANYRAVAESTHTW